MERTENLESTAPVRKRKKRRRLSRPVTLVFFGIVFMALPFVNILSIAYLHDIPLNRPEVVLATLGLFEFFILVAPFVVGIGLLSIKAFLFYSALAIGYNLYTILMNPAVFNVRALALTVLGVAAAIYFLRKDVAVPYFRMYPRGWRFQKRKPVEMEIIIDGEHRQTKDIGERGVFVVWPECAHEPGDSVKIHLTLNGVELRLKAGVVRIDENGAGLAYRDLTREQLYVLRRVAKTL